jgi:hypothetical protein
MTKSQRLRIIVGGLVGQFPLGGVAWDYFHYLLGLHELGHEVYYHEDTWVWPFDPVLRSTTDNPDYTVRFIADFFAAFAPELQTKWHYVLLHEKHHGMSEAEFNRVAESADIFLNVSGACFIPENLSPKCLTVFLDTDPGYNQIMLAEKFAWSQNVERWCKQVAAHDRHLTYAENIYGPDCAIPRVGIDWRPTRCVVTLPQWKSVKDAAPPPGAPFSTVLTWDYFGGHLIHNGVRYGTKVEEYEKFHDLPRRVATPLTLAVGGDKAPWKAIADDGWIVSQAHEATLTPQSYQRLISQSAGEWSIAKNVYTATRSGWFSCRTACYLAGGRPAVVQDTGWSRFIPPGSGLFAFSTMEEAIDGLNRAVADPAAQRLAAYAIAREYLAPDKVLPPMIDAIFRSKPNNAGQI